MSHDCCPAVSQGCSAAVTDPWRRKQRSDSVEFFPGMHKLEIFPEKDSFQIFCCVESDVVFVVGVAVFHDLHFVAVIVQKLYYNVGNNWNLDTPNFILFNICIYSLFNTSNKIWDPGGSIAHNSLVLVLASLIVWVLPRCIPATD